MWWARESSGTSISIAEPAKGHSYARNITVAASFAMRISPTLSTIIMASGAAESSSPARSKSICRPVSSILRALPASLGVVVTLLFIAVALRFVLLIDSDVVDQIWPLL